jgi:hypothetical protein
VAVKRFRAARAVVLRKVLGGLAGLRAESEALDAEHADIWRDASTGSAWL